MTIHSREEMDEILRTVGKADFKITDIKTTERIRKAPLPFTTSTMQAGGCKGAEFRNTEDDADRPAAL